MHSENLTFYIVLLLISFSVFSCDKGNKIQKHPEQPNFIVILTDDQGYGDLGCYGSPNILTPNIDKMAQEGMRFTNFYAAPFCGPSRAQIMTGCYHPRVSHSYNDFPNSKTGLNPDEITIAEILKDAGYSTMCIGKWHLGDHKKFLPTKQGFDKYFGLPYSNDMWPYYHHSGITENLDTALMNLIKKRARQVGYPKTPKYYFPPLPLMQDEEIIERNPDQTQLTTRYTEEALKFIEENRNQPFFLYLAHAMPHVPLFVSKKFEGKSEAGLYGDVIMEIDWSCGQIIDKLKDLGIDNNTMVIFTSDNGPWLAYGIHSGSAGPLRGGKNSIWEGGMRVPAIFWWPGKIPSGQRTSVLSGNFDLLPTLANLAKGSVPDDRVIDGKNISPVLLGESALDPHKYIYYFRVGNKVRLAAIRDKNWKLIFENNEEERLIPIELYDLEADVGEKYNRIKQHPEIVESMLEQAKRFQSECSQNKRPLGRIE